MKTVTKENMVRSLALIALGWLMAEGPLLAAGAGSSAGLNLINDMNARASSLAGALGSDVDEIGSLAYNPASLATLKGAQACLQYGHGITDDSLGQAAAGMPVSHGTIGTSLFLYQGGRFDLFDGETHRTVRAQTDVLLSLGYGATSRRLDWGLSAKYFHSDLIEMAHATTMAIDLGVARTVNKNIRVGSSLQNLGSGLRYDHAKTQLPRIFRLSSSYKLNVGASPMLFLLDVPYYLNERKPELRLGFEALLGGVQTRFGYVTGFEQVSGYTVGFGFPLGKTTIDYNFSLIQTLDNAQKISVTYRFGSPKSKPRPVMLLDAQAADRIDQMLEAKRLRDEMKNDARNKR